MIHQFHFRVYYEDTDLAGIVYYANYFKFIERARTEFLRSLGMDQTELKRNPGVVFAVRKVEADFLLSARFDDELQVTTEVSRVSGARITLSQTIFRDRNCLFHSIVCLACISESGRPVRIPDAIYATMSKITKTNT